MNRRLLPRINFRAYRRPIYLHCCYDEWGWGAVKLGQSYTRGSCPICESADQRTRSFAWNFDKCSFYCFKCGRNGDALELVKQVKKCSVIEAAKWLEERGGESGSGLVLLPDPGTDEVGTIPS